MTKDPKRPTPKPEPEALSCDELEAVRGGMDLGARPEVPQIPGFPSPTFPDPPEIP